MFLMRKNGHFEVMTFNPANLPQVQRIVKQDQSFIPMLHNTKDWIRSIN